MYSRITYLRFYRVKNGRIRGEKMSKKQKLKRLWKREANHVFNEYPILMRRPKNAFRRYFKKISLYIFWAAKRKSNFYCIRRLLKRFCFWRTNFSCSSLFCDFFLSDVRNTKSSLPLRKCPSTSRKKKKTSTIVIMEDLFFPWKGELIFNETFTLKNAY